MQLHEALGWLFRWLHILAAMAVVGGPMYVRFALLPAAGELPDEPRRILQEGVRRRWSMVVRCAILLLLISGFYNYFMFLTASKSWGAAWPPDANRLYQMLFGIKFLLAIAIFFLAEALTGRSAAFARFREQAKFWVTINLLLGIVLVGLSSELRMTHIGPPPAPASAPAK